MNIVGFVGTGVTCLPTADRVKVGTVGPALKGSEIKIDPTESILHQVRGMAQDVDTNRPN